MEENFKKALKFTLAFEGGYSNHPADRGGATNFGITQKTYDIFNAELGLDAKDVKAIKPAEVETIYLADYWERLSPAAMTEKLQIAAFDFAVNSGVGRATSYLQRAAGVKPDGIIGPKTEAKLQELGDALLQPYLQARLDFLRRIARGSQKQFLAGWESRVSRLAKSLGVKLNFGKGEK